MMREMIPHSFLCTHKTCTESLLPRLCIQSGPGRCEMPGAKPKSIAVYVFLTTPGDICRRVSFAQEGQLFHVMVAGGVVHLCMADEAMGRRVPFAFLEDIRARFAAAHSNPADQEPFSLNDEFAPVLAARMEFYNTDPSADAISRTRVAMDDVKKIMINNIEQVLDRGERIELLVHKTDSLQAQAFTFRRQSRRLHHHMWWKNVRLTAAIIASVLIVIYLLVAFHCGSLLLHCHHH
mmetsp:Transcript_17319/g.51858  ORF Transcript_17319/g.51858 Transcript_17319/m.51858 type:complete len:236 (+) Transcript_17319:377-1084(+)